MPPNRQPLPGPPATPPEHRRVVVRRRIAALLVSAIVLTAVTIVSSSSPRARVRSYASPLAAKASGRGFLARGSALALPGNILVSDRRNNRLLVISPRGQVAWSHSIKRPGAAILSPTDRSLVVTRQSASVVLQISLIDGRTVYKYGRRGRSGTATDQLREPQTGVALSDRRLLLADRASCRILIVRPPSHRPSTTLGEAGVCLHDPAKTFAHPDAAFPTRAGDIVVSEPSPGWVDFLTRKGHLLSAVRIGGLSALDDANEFAPGRFVATSNSRPGAVEEFTTTGRVLWRFAPASGLGELDRPSLAQVLPNGDVLVSDSDNDRIIVIDPRRNVIVWQYGHTRRAGSDPGYLDAPESAILLPRT